MNTSPLLSASRSNDASAARPYAPSPGAVVLPDGSILGVRPPQLPDRETTPATTSAGGK